MRFLIILALVAVLAAASSAQGLVCCDDGPGAATCKSTMDCAMVDRCGAAECGTTSQEGELCGCNTPATPCTGSAPTECSTCVDGQWVEDPVKLDECGKCNSDCKAVAQNLAITGDGCLVVGGVDILKKIAELEAQCGSTPP
jgi:hypothetical protein